ncbi:hypothetical protein ACFWN7_00130 [Agromyces sp. NPDC058484]
MPKDTADHLMPGRLSPIRAAGRIAAGANGAAASAIEPGVTTIGWRHGD